MPIKLTESQRLAVEKNGNILVAAAAGSGKTAVLVERVISKLCSKENPIGADKLLIVTFTNAVAAEMRGRIEKRLDEECRKNPNDTGLLLQKHLLSTAKICTIDSFCIDFVRENFENLGISPDFTISDGNTLKALDREVLNQILNEYFQSGNEIFMELLDIVGAEFDEGKLSDLILSLYEYSRQLPFPEKWFNALPQYYANGFADGNIWRDLAMESAEKTVKELKNNLANAVDLLSVNSKMADKFLPAFMLASEELNRLDNAVKCKDWDGIYNSLNAFIIPSLPVVRGSNDIPQVKAAKDIYDNLKKKGIEGLNKLFYADSRFISLQFKKLYKPIALLTEILKEFSNRVFEAYVDANTFTFHNTESMALQLLCSENEGEISINPEAAEFLNAFEEVCVDEYQDTNDLQNMLFYVLSGKDSRLFAVGDVKQSIYGFRGANPDYFLNKKNTYMLADMAQEGQPVKIILGNNFRSRPEVCDFINFFFGNFMTDKTGKINYNREEMLIPSGMFPESGDTFVSMDIIEANSNEENKVLEARQIANFIRETMSKGDIIRKDENTLRRAEFSDFTILLRSMKNNAGVIAEELRRQGIPVNFSAEGFCEYTEIAVMLSLLKVIDNPLSDIELLAVMMSPIFGFTAEDMAKIRINCKDAGLYKAVTLYAQNGDIKTKDFLKEIQKYRLFAVTSTLPQLLNILYEETGFLNTVSAYNDGVRRRNNLLLLVQYAESYSAASKGTVYGFTDFITKQSEKGIKSAGAVSSENAVQIMSIHASKGLQFPVCIIAGTASAFNNSESRENSTYSSKYGLGFKYFDEEDKVPYSTVSREVILERIRAERIEEELRLLYVAMTRTEDILHFTAVVSNIEKKCQDIKSRLLGSNNTVTENLLSTARSYFDWLLTALMLHPDGYLLRGSGSTVICRETQSQIKVRTVYDVVNNGLCNQASVAEIALEDEFFERVKANIGYKYPFEELLDLQSKASVSVLANKAQSEKYNFTAQPSFMSEGGITAAGRGTAMHKVMQFFDFSKWQTPEKELERLYEWQFLSEAEAKSVNISALKSFFESEVFLRIQNAKRVEREMRFLTELPARIVNNSLSERFDGEVIIVQGAVDLCLIEDDGIIVLDFKTDRTDNPEALALAYGEQLNIYAKALEKIFEKPVKEKIIYSFSLSKEVKL